LDFQLEGFAPASDQGKVIVKRDEHPVDRAERKKGKVGRILK
jgi:hypothetical protein